ncbi:hypothetical protein QRX60_11445 [Amycolatopsis mongoliensis]|uniref:Uncharacterized protein n=1 Tax=Amycolatopsis mongoliensis TaxID=715475 RepID=A0A9Y2JTG9_9PSEU|nr:hypothetical protein [Amycolatopsis sp. 4-36]WIY04421.1 hypothetical protein QRX60_11445 [Amycolatopsis sp. 4-36]
MADFRMIDPHYWIVASFIIVGVVGCEAAAAWHEDSLHLHTPEYSVDFRDNGTYGATGAAGQLGDLSAWDVRWLS